VSECGCVCVCVWGGGGVASTRSITVEYGVRLLFGTVTDDGA